MIHLLLSTLAMMGLTFLIGFFVAAVIKLIAYAADSFDFYSSHRLELLRLRRWRQHRQKVEISVKITVRGSTETLLVIPAIIMA